MSNKLLPSKSVQNNTVTRLTSSAAPAVHDDYGPNRLASYFMDDAYYSGSECHQAEKKHQLAVNMDDTNSVRLNLEKQSRKRSGSSQNFLLPSSSKRNKLWLGGWSVAAESEDISKRVGDRRTELYQMESSHKAGIPNKQALLNLKKVEEEESHDEGRWHGREGKGTQQNISHDKRKEKIKLNPNVAPPHMSYQESIRAPPQWTQRENAGERTLTGFMSQEAPIGHGFVFRSPNSERLLGRYKYAAAGTNHVSAQPEGGARMNHLGSSGNHPFLHGQCHTHDSRTYC